MSAFGPGTPGYTPNWRQSSQPQSMAQQIAPDTAMPIWSPQAQANNVYADPTVHKNGTYTFNNGETYGRRDSSAGPMIDVDPWANPLDSLYTNSVGGLNMGWSGGRWDPSMGMDKRGDPIFNYAVEESRNSAGQLEYAGAHGGAHGVDDAIQGYAVRGFDAQGRSKDMANNAKELYDKLGSMSTDQLMRLSGGGLSLADKFSNVAQQYANAYANPKYGKYVRGQQHLAGFGGNPLSQQETTDWLQKSYDKAFEKLNSVGLL